MSFIAHRFSHVLTCGNQDILPQPMSGVQGLFGMLLGNVRPSVTDTVVHVKRTVLAIAWLAINQSVCKQIWLSGSHEAHHVHCL